jgi:LysM repeat protein
MNRIAVVFSMMILTQWVSARTVTYVVFDRDCMNQLSFRFAYPNEKSENPVSAFSLHPNALENYIFISDGAGQYASELPTGALLCSKLKMSDGLVSAINKGDREVTIVVERQEGGYWLTPIGSAILIAQNGPKYWIRSKYCSFAFDTLHKETDKNLAVSGSPTAVYFKGSAVRHCLTEYSFHGEVIKGSSLRSDIKLIPSIGFTVDQTGSSSAIALANEMMIDRVNDLNIEDYILQTCLDGGKSVVIKALQKTSMADQTEPAVDKAVVNTDSSEIKDPIVYQYEGKPLLIRCSEKLGDGYHVVQRGDNLMGISRTYGVDIHSIIAWNDIVDPDKIKVCQVIWYQKPPEKVTDSSAKGVMLDSSRHYVPENKVVDQRKLHKLAAMTEVKVLFLDNPAEDRSTDTLNTQGMSLKTVGYEYFDDVPPSQVVNDSLPMDKVKKDDQGGGIEVSLGPKVTAGESDTAKNNSSQFKKYVTRPGDTLQSIATLYKVDPAALAWLNGLGLEDRVIPGKTFLIPLK